MYYPYLRSKQFELLALRQLLDHIDFSRQISPVIEPVREGNSTFSSTISKMIDKEVTFTIILNPMVGSYAEMGVDRIEKCLELIPEDYPNCKLGIIINSNTNVKALYEKIKELQIKPELNLFLETSVSDKDLLFKLIDKFNFVNIFVTNNIERRLLRQLRQLQKPLIMWNDNFKKLPRNSDYINDEDEFYSDDHLFYSEENYVGFSDFQTIGKSYSDTGFSPFAIAIHLTYFDDEENFRVRHFVSESNDDRNDIGGKFAEANQKLVSFVDENNIETLATKEFNDLYEEEKYPGLGSVKKLSIMHHLELVYNFLNNG